MEKLKINGSEKLFSERVPSSLKDLLRQMDLDSAAIVAEVDGRIIKKEKFETTPLHSGQSIELIRFVGGG